MGGHCLPVDPFYLAFKAREHDFYPEFIELAGKVNQAQPAFCAERIERREVVYVATSRATSRMKSTDSSGGSAMSVSSSKSLA